MTAARFPAFGRLLLALALALPIAAPAARAQLFVDNDARAAAGENAEKISNVTGVVRDLNERINNLEKQRQQLRRQMTELSREKQQLTQTVREIKGALTEIRRDLGRQAAEAGAGENRQKALTALGEKVGKLEKAVALLQQYATPPPESELYAAASESFQKQEFEKAVEGFRRVISLYPDGQFGVNSRYWISEAHLSMAEYERALADAQTLIKDHPNSDKQPDALLVIAKALRGLNRGDEAAKILRRLLENHPTSLAADKARQLPAR